MKKEQFLRELQVELAKTLPIAETAQAITYYSELIDDAVEAGRTEEDAVSRLPNPQKIASGIKDDSSQTPVIEQLPRIVEKIFDEGESKSGVSAVPPAEPKPEIKKDTPPPVPAPPVIAPTTATSAPATSGSAAPEFAPSSALKKKAPKSASGVGTVFKIIGLFFFCITVVPIVAGLAAGGIGVFVGLWAASGSLVVAGVAAPIMAVVNGIMSSSFMIFAVYCGAGLIVLGLGLLAVKGMIYVTKGIWTAVKALFDIIRKAFIA